jgi:hypothetical protein
MLIYINFKFNFLTKYHSFILNCWRIRMFYQDSIKTFHKSCTTFAAHVVNGTDRFEWFQQLSFMTLTKLLSLKNILPTHLWCKGPFPLKKNFPRTENFPKISLLKVENFQLQNFFPTENVGQSHFTKFSFCGKFSWVETGLNKFTSFTYQRISGRKIDE